MNTAWQYVCVRSFLSVGSGDKDWKQMKGKQQATHIVQKNK